MTHETREFTRRHFFGLTTGAMMAANRALADSSKSSENTQPAFVFAVIADPHCAEEPKKGIESYGSGVEKLLRCFEIMEALPQAERPDFVLLAGDIHPEALAPHLDKITFPVHAVAGNHEGTEKTRSLLRSLFPDDFGRDDKTRDYYSFVHKGVRFIGLCDAGMGGEHVGLFSSELIHPSGQCEWLEEELVMPESRKVVYAHIPPALDGGDRNMYMGRNDSRWFLNLIEKTAPDLLFFGHLHQATEEYTIGATRGINLRSCCWNFAGAPLGFMLVHVNGEGMHTREIITGEYAEG